MSGARKAFSSDSNTGYAFSSSASARGLVPRPSRLAGASGLPSASAASARRLASSDGRRLRRLGAARVRRPRRGLGDAPRRSAIAFLAFGGLAAFARRRRCCFLLGSLGRGLLARGSRRRPSGWRHAARPRSVPRGPAGVPRRVDAEGLGRPRSASRGRWTVPPAASIFSRRDFVNASATTNSATSTARRAPRILSGFVIVRTSPTARRTSWLTVSGAAFLPFGAPGRSPDSNAPRSAAAAIAPTFTTS